MAWEYVSGGAADELTLRWNHESYERIRLRTRNLVDVSKIDTRITLFGRERPFPILIAPAAYQKMIHPEGELASVRGAGAAGATMVLSCFSNVTVEEVAAAAQCPTLVSNLRASRTRLHRQLGPPGRGRGLQALVVSIDTPVLGPRYRETRIKFALPPGLERANLKGLATALGGQRPNEQTIYSATLDPTVTWKDIAWLRSLTRLPVLLKGILNDEDAARAVDAGVAGIIVSNHGGRNLDTVPATIDALPQVIARVAGRVPVLVDGGILRGTDVIKALATGASAVLIGRPALYGLAVNGAEGVTHVLNILRREFAMAMALTGRTTIAAIDGSVIWR